MKILFLAVIIFSVSFAQDFVELKQPNSNKIILKLMFKNGSISDPVGKEGLTFTTANLITQSGTGELSYNDIQKKIFPMAAEYSVSVDKEVTVFTFAVHKDWLDDFYPIITGLVLNPSFDKDDFERVKSNQQIYVDQEVKSSSDEEYSKKLLEDMLFRNTNYQHMTQGKSSSVKSITLDDVKNHYKTFFARNNLLVGIAGNYSDDFLEQLKTDLSKLPATVPNVPQADKAKMPSGINVEIVQKDNAFGSAVFTGSPIDVTRSNNDFIALMVANSYLGEHRKSYGRLYQQIRELRAMNYGDYSYIEWYKDGGFNQLPPSGVPRSSNYFALWIRPVQIAKQLKRQYKELGNIKIGHAHFAIRMAIRELDKLISGLSEEDFLRTREFLRSYIKLYISSPSEQLGYLMDSKFYGRNDFISEADSILASLTLEDVNKAVKKYLQSKNMDIVIVTDKSEAKPLAKSLLHNLPSPMSYSDLVKKGLPKEVLQEDKQTENYKLNIKSVKIINSEDTFK